MILEIGKPYIDKNRLISEIKYADKKYNMFFEVEEDYVNYLCTENANSFLIALIPFIVKNEFDVKINGKISSRLYYQLTNYLIPLLCKKFKKRIIDIEGDLSDQKFDSNGVGASISCGVDSFYTLLKNINNVDSAYNITHLTFFNAGSHGEFGGKEARNLYKKRLSRIKEFCKENNYKLVTVDSNMNELIMMNHEKTHTFRTLSCVFALEKLFGKYYFASGLNFNNSHIDERDTSYYDILNVYCLNNENISFYCSGLDTSRMEKVNFISESSITYNWLNVCVRDSGDNCGKCIKCIRTMTALDSIGKLDRYKNVFNLNYFYKKRKKIYAEVLISNRDKLQHELLDEIIKSCKKNNVKIPLLSYIISILPCKSNIKAIIPKNLLKVTRRIRKIHITNNDGWIN